MQMPLKHEDRIINNNESKSINECFNEQDTYIGLSNVDFEIPEEFPLGDGVILCKVNAYVYANNWISPFKPDARGQPAHGVVDFSLDSYRSYEIKYQLYIPKDYAIPIGLNKLDIASIIVALFRLKAVQGLLAPIASNVTFTVFDDIASNTERAYDAPEKLRGKCFHLLEFESNKLELMDNKTMAGIKDVEWVKNHWHNTVKLFLQNQNFWDAFNAHLYSFHSVTESLALVTIWGALERLFLRDRLKLKYRISLNIASFLEPPGNERKALFQTIKTLYNERSKSAHGKFYNTKIKDGKKIFYTTVKEFQDSNLVLKRCLVKMIELNQIPTPPEIKNAC